MFRSLHFVVGLCIGFALVQSEIRAAKPNIVFILADDMGWNNLSCYGSDLHETPRLDRLATEGVRFTNAYSASPVCSPTRAAILTGKSPARLKMTIWREGAAQGQGNRPLTVKALDSLPISHLTIAEVLKQAGYYTAHVGKWHVGRPEGYPQPHGFRVNIGGTLWGAPETYFYPYNEDYADYFESWRYVPDLEPGKAGDYLTDRLTDKALEIIESCQDRPFFLNLWYHSVHTPVEGKPSLVEKYKQKIKETSPSVHRNPYLAAMVESMDQNVGRILDRLEELGLSDNTIVVFNSDNGGYIGSGKRHPDIPVTNNSPLRSGKGSCYEGGIRVPLIMRAPGSLRGAVCDTPVYSCDFYPTFLAMTGQSGEAQDQLDGVDLSPLLRRAGATVDRDALQFHYPHYYPTTTPVSSIREGDWKLLHYYEDARVELYRLSEDLSESRECSQQYPRVVERLQSRLRAWLLDVSAELPQATSN